MGCKQRSQRNPELSSADSAGSGFAGLRGVAMLKEAAEKFFFIVLLGLTSPVVWATCLAALGVFAAASIRRKRVAWRVLSHSSFLILSVSAVAGCWEFFGVGDLAFNLAS